ncbi:MAG TPA: anhydro-N-acetylmuramic acid kinase [Planctomycetota bacterium]|nr:anhydro-N-acetylmuramic acid kinase [Planctomycetota bacterium]
MSRLDAIARKDPRLVIGLNSGTSMDGVDAALVRFSGPGDAPRFEILAHLVAPHDAALRERLLGAPAFSTEEACRLHRELGESFAAAAAGVASAAGVALGDVDLVGSHGQTVCHLPGASGAPTSTLQLGDLDVVAARTGLPVVGDFRAADAAHGGAGAPLMPRLDLLLFRGLEGVLALNLGGIACLTWLPGGDAGVLAFDVGPCNAPLDLFAARATYGRLRFDLDGVLAAGGRVRPALLRRLLEHPYFAALPPKTSGRETFGEAYARSVWDETRAERIGPEDLLATHAFLVGAATGQAVDRFVPGGRDAVMHVVAAGGGVRNPAIRAGLEAAFPGRPLRTTDEFGVPSDAREALLFAFLAHERAFGRPSNVPSVTGARVAASLGKVAG